MGEATRSLGGGWGRQGQPDGGGDLKLGRRRGSTWRPAVGGSDDLLEAGGGVAKAPPPAICFCRRSVLLCRCEAFHSPTHPHTPPILHHGRTPLCEFLSKLMRLDSLVYQLT